MRKLYRSVSLIVLIVAAAAAANCVASPTPSPTATPAATALPAASPTSGPVVYKNYSYDEQVALINQIFDDRYVHDRLIRIGWRNIHDVPVSATNIVYMSCHEIAPGLDRVRTLPAIVITAGNASEAGVNLVAFYDPGRKSVAYIGFVPRSGAPFGSVAFAATTNGVRETIAGSDAEHNYQNVTIVDTGYRKGMNLTEEEDDVVRSVAVGNATVKAMIGTHRYVVENTMIWSTERGLPNRYVIAYPEVTIQLYDGGSASDEIHVLVDGRKGTVIDVRLYDQYDWE